MPGKKTWFNLEIGLRAVVSAAGNRRATSSRSGPVDLYVCVVDHFEPQVGRPEQATSRARLEDWLRRYPQIAARHRDADGRPPRHSFFYPWDEYDEWEFEHLAEHCAAGWGEIDLHLHHADDTEESLRRMLREAIAAYHSRGALSRWPDGRLAFGFIHGNWALDNSLRDYCGVDNELTVLRQEGCYADFTFPAWQHRAQPRQTNSVYYAVDDPARPKSYDSGLPVQAGRRGKGDLLIVQGPLVPYFDRRRGVPRPAVDDGDLAAYRRYTPERMDRWVRAGIHVAGRPDRILVKLHCHGAADGNREALLGDDLEALFSDLEARYNDGRRYRLHYVTARELFNVVKATEAEASGDTRDLADWLLPAPHRTSSPSDRGGSRVGQREPAGIDRR